jgi:hypothetical protein
MREKAAADAEWMEAMLRGPLGNSAVFEEWCAQAHTIRGWSRATFKRRLQGFKKRRPELTGGRFRGDPYSLSTPSTGAMAMVERMASLRSGLTPARLASLQKINLIESGPSGSSGSIGLSSPAPSGEDLIIQATAHARLKGEVR